jgi:hypothetical protein
MLVCYQSLDVINTVLKGIYSISRLITYNFRIGNNDSYLSTETTTCPSVAERALWYLEHDLHNSSGQEIHQYNPCTFLPIRLPLTVVRVN